MTERQTAATRQEDILQRLVRLETEIATIARERRDDRKELREMLDRLDQKVSGLVTIKDQGKGWLAAIIFAAGILGAVIKYAFERLVPGA